jgi:hypothetical protein
MSWGAVNLLEEQTTWVFPSLIFTFQRQATPHHALNSLPWEQDVHISLSLKYRYHSRTKQDVLQVLYGHHLCIDCTVFWRGWTLDAPPPYSSWQQMFTIYWGFTFSFSKKRSN